MPGTRSLPSLVRHDGSGDQPPTIPSGPALAQQVTGTPCKPPSRRSDSDGAATQRWPRTRTRSFCTTCSANVPRPAPMMGRLSRLGLRESSPRHRSSNHLSPCAYLATPSQPAAVASLPCPLSTRLCPAASCLPERNRVAGWVTAGFSTPRSENNTYVSLRMRSKNAAVRGGQRGALQFSVSFP